MNTHLSISSCWTIVPSTKDFIEATSERHQTRSVEWAEASLSRVSEALEPKKICQGIDIDVGQFKKLIILAEVFNNLGYHDLKLWRLVCKEVCALFDMHQILPSISKFWERTVAHICNRHILEMKESVNEQLSMISFVELHNLKCRLFFCQWPRFSDEVVHYLQYAENLLEALRLKIESAEFPGLQQIVSIDLLKFPNLADTFVDNVHTPVRRNCVSQSNPNSRQSDYFLGGY